MWPKYCNESDGERVASALRLIQVGHPRKLPRPNEKLAQTSTQTSAEGSGKLSVQASTGPINLASSTREKKSPRHMLETNRATTQASSRHLRNLSSMNRLLSWEGPQHPSCRQFSSSRSLDETTRPLDLRQLRDTETLQERLPESHD